MPLFEGLNISQYSELCEAYMGKYPVISLTLMDAKNDTLEGALSSLQEVVSKEFRRHIEAVNAYPYSRERIVAILNFEDKPAAKFDTSIGFLSDILVAFYKKTCEVIIET